MGGDQLVCQNVVKGYGGAFTLGPLSLEIGTGVTCVVGPNGAGKSTLFRLMAGVERANSGSVALRGESPRPRLGFLPQDPQLPGAATCEEFLHYVAWLQQILRSDRAASVADALARVGLTDRRAAKIRTLSGGMRRRLGVAHALVHDPVMLLLDEPTVGLDPRQRISLRDTVAGLSGDRIVIVSTHLVEDVRGFADRIIVLNDGAVVYDGGVAPLEARADATAPGATDLERAIAMLIGEPT